MQVMNHGILKKEEEIQYVIKSGEKSGRLNKTKEI